MTLDRARLMLSTMREVRMALVSVAVAGLLVGCAPPATSDSTLTSPVTFDSVVDGDTIETSDGTVRIIGIDAPERGACGYAEASALVSSLLSQGDATILELP